MNEAPAGDQNVPPGVASERGCITLTDVSINLFLQPSGCELRGRYPFASAYKGLGSFAPSHSRVTPFSMYGIYLVRDIDLTEGLSARRNNYLPRNREQLEHTAWALCQCTDQHRDLWEGAT